MKLTIFLETRFSKTPDQKVWSDIGPDTIFWQRYLDVFASVEVVARVLDVDTVPSSYKRSDSERIRFIPLPCYIGPFQFIQKAAKIKKIVTSVINDAEAVLLRTPGQASNCAYRPLNINQHPYGVEVVGDPYDVFAPGSVDHPLRPFFRWWITRQLKKQCTKAVAAAYVTENTLQRRYPNMFYSTYYSSIDLRKEAYVLSPRVDFATDGFLRLIILGSLEQLYKSPDILIDAFSLCNSKGHRIKLKIVGDGKFRPLLEAQVARLGLNDSIKFLGKLSAGEAVRKELLQSDLFILPSRTEGLPRAMIEAMACGLPCIGSNVGGMPELLPAEDLVPPGNIQALAKKIEEIITNPERMRTMSARNLKKSLEFRNDILDQRRFDFYTYLRDKTELWIQKQNV